MKLPTLALTALFGFSLALPQPNPDIIIEAIVQEGTSPSQSAVHDLKKQTSSSASHGRMSHFGSQAVAPSTYIQFLNFNPSWKSPLVSPLCQMIMVELFVDNTLAYHDFPSGSSKSFESSIAGLETDARYLEQCIYYGERCQKGDRCCDWRDSCQLGIEGDPDWGECLDDGNWVLRRN